MKNRNKIPPFKLVPQPLNDEALNLPKFKWASEEIGSRHQLGGDPTFLQGEEWPDCPSCSKNMTFYAQLDSINDHLIIADCGILYVFLCFDCNETKSFVQSS